MVHGILKSNRQIQHSRDGLCGEVGKVGQPG